MTTEPKVIRGIESLSMLWPLAEGDYVELEGPEGSNLWQVCRGSYGWNLKRQDGICLHTHPTIKDIDGMSDLIGAIFEWCKGYSS